MQRVLPTEPHLIAGNEVNLANGRIGLERHPKISCPDEFQTSSNLRRSIAGLQDELRICGIALNQTDTLDGPLA